MKNLNSKLSILVVLLNDEYIRNYVTTDALSILRKEYDVTLLVSSDAKNLDLLPDNSGVEFYLSNKQTQLSHYRLLDLLTWRYKKKSISFRFRLSRRRRLDLDEVWALRPLWKLPHRLIFFMWWWSKRYCHDVFFHNYAMYPLYSTYLKRTLKENKSLSEAIERLRPRIIICPVSAFDPDAMDLIHEASKQSIKTLFLADNWDNVSSKSIYWRKPDFLAVWGEQSEVHARVIQDFRPENIFKLGTPRYQQYYNLRNTELLSPFNFPYILFVGTALKYDEIMTLKVLAEVLHRNPTTFSGVRIIYRPHPFRQNTRDPRDAIADLVDIDPQLLRSLDEAPRLPSLDYYPNLILNSELVVGGLTSMVIESTIMGKAYVAMVHDDAKNYTSQHRVLKSYEHFRELDRLSNVHFCDNLPDLESIFLKLWDIRNSADQNKLDSECQFFLYNDEVSYPQRLVNLVDSIVS